MFSVVPFDFLESRLITDEEFRILTALLARVKNTGESSVYYQGLAKMTGKPVKRLLEIVKSLISKKIVTPTLHRGDMPVRVHINYFKPIDPNKKEEVFKFDPS